MGTIKETDIQTNKRHKAMSHTFIVLISGFVFLLLFIAFSFNEQRNIVCLTIAIISIAVVGCLIRQYIIKLKYQHLLHQKRRERQKQNAILYSKLIEHRRRYPKSYGLTNIAIVYEDIYHYARSKQRDSEELYRKIDYLNKRIKECCTIIT